MRAGIAIALALVTFVGCGGNDDEKGSSQSSSKSPEERRKTLQRLDSKQVAERVQKLRGLEYDPFPKFKIVTRKQSAAYVVKQVGGSGNVAEDEEVAKVLGIIPPDLSLEELGSSVGGEALAGYYNGRPPTVALVAGPSADDPASAELTLAHEMLHGLDDQRFGIFEQVKRDNQGPSDRSSAYAALVEGDAELLTAAYGKKYGLKEAEPSEEQEEDASKLPFAFLLQVAFTYKDGAKFVQDLMKRGNGQDLLDQAFKERPPVSTAQVLHPKLYTDNVTPVDVPLSPGPVLGGGWTKLDDTTFGELEVLQLIAFDEDQVEEFEDAAEGWAGGSLQLWRKGEFDQKACPAPCRKNDTVVIGVRWRGDADAKEFDEALGASLGENQDAEAAGDGAFKLKGGAVAFSSTGRGTTVAYAPTPQLAERLAARAGG